MDPLVCPRSSFPTWIQIFYSTYWISLVWYSLPITLCMCCTLQSVQLLIHRHSLSQSHASCCTHTPNTCRKEKPKKELEKEFLMRRQDRLGMWHDQTSVHKLLTGNKLLLPSYFPIFACSLPHLLKQTNKQKLGSFPSPTSYPTSYSNKFPIIRLVQYQNAFLGAVAGVQVSVAQEFLWLLFE